MSGSSGRPRGFGGVPLGPVTGVAGVLLLFVIIFVTQEGRFGEGADLERVDAPLARLAPLPSAAPGQTGPEGAPGPRPRPVAFAEAVEADANARWAASFEPSGTDFAPMEQPLPDAVARDLGREGGPPGLVTSYAIARIAASEVQRQLGIREAASDAAEDDPPVREEVARRLRLQAACLAGVYLGSAYGPDVIDAPAARIALDAGLVQGTRSGEEDAWLLRGARGGDPGACRGFGDGSSRTAP